jgi:hypothetical protein
MRSYTAPVLCWSTLSRHMPANHVIQFMVLHSWRDSAVRQRH